MAEAHSWPSILQYGLLSTTALLDLYNIKGQQRASIETHHRPDSITITHSTYGSAVIRDQKPMHESALEKCLIECSPRAWYEFLNRKVFFWLTQERVNTLLNARAYRRTDHVVIVINSRALVDKHANDILLSPINSGSTIYRPVRRGTNTFQPLSEYPYKERMKARGKRHAIAELAIDYSVPSIRRLVLKVERWRGEQLLEILYPT